MRLTPTGTEGLTQIMKNRPKVGCPYTFGHVVFRPTSIGSLLRRSSGLCLLLQYGFISYFSILITNKLWIDHNDGNSSDVRNGTEARERERDWVRVVSVFDSCSLFISALSQANHAGLTAWRTPIKRLLLAVTHMSPWQLACQIVRDWQLPQLGCKQQWAWRHTVQAVGVSFTCDCHKT